MRESSAMVQLVAGPAIWAAQFLIVYATESLFCSRGGGADAHHVLVLVTTGIAAALLVVRLILRYRARRSSGTTSDFLRDVGTGLDLLALLAVVWTGSPALLLASCTLPV
ncbi:hypothetical protein V5G24_06205 [Xanthobacter sp. VTT E-85241]|uniref:hypothetical protein n=1 Tax=Roseixanthobacter finlandensis TaxID=3119922 RepID=UPI003726699C